MAKKQLNFEERLRLFYGDMPQAEKRMGSFLMRFPGDIAKYNAGELAAAAGTSRAATTRFFKRLGYRNFSEARKEIREASDWGSPLYRATDEFNQKEKSSFLQDYLQKEIASLTRTIDGLDPDDLQEVLDTIMRVRRVQVWGFRNSYVLASYLQRQLKLVRANVELLPHAGQTWGEDLIDLGPDDLLIFIGMRRRTKAATRILQVARGQGVPCCLIADPSVSKLAELATWTLTCQVQSLSLLDSYSSAMSVLGLLSSALLQESEVDGNIRVRKIEKMHETLDELDPFPWLVKG